MKSPLESCRSNFEWALVRRVVLLMRTPWALSRTPTPSGDCRCSVIGASSHRQVGAELVEHVLDSSGFGHHAGGSCLVEKNLGLRRRAVCCRCLPFHWAVLMCSMPMMLLGSWLTTFAWLLDGCIEQLRRDTGGLIVTHSCGVAPLIVGRRRECGGPRPTRPSKISAVFA